MTVSLTPDQAAAKISEIETARDHAVQKLNQIQDSQHSMLSTGWHGDSATKYHTTTSQQHDDFTEITKQLDALVRAGSDHIRSITHADNS